MQTEERNIRSVEFVYIGTDTQFSAFLKSVITDYLSENRLIPEEYSIDKELKRSA